MNILLYINVKAVKVIKIVKNKEIQIANVANENKNCFQYK